MDEFKQNNPDAQQEAPAAETAKDRIDTTLEDLKEKAAPVMNRVKDAVEDGVQDAIDAVKDASRDAFDDVKGVSKEALGAVKDAAQDVFETMKGGMGKLGSLFGGSKPAAPQEKNEFFSGLEEEAQALKEGAKAKAQEMQQMLEKMMGKKD